MKNFKKPLSVIAIMSMLTSCELVADSISNQDGSTVAITQEMKNQIQKAIQNIDINNISENNIDEILNKFTKVELKPDSKRSEISTHFNNLKEILTIIKDTFNNKIDNNTTETIDKIIAAVTKLSGTTNANISIGEINSNSNTKASIISNTQSVQNIINEIKKIVEIAQTFGINIEKENNNNNNPVNATDNTKAPAALNGGNGGAGTGAGTALAKIVEEINASAMIDKISKAQIAHNNISNTNNNDAGQLITGTTSDGKGAGAKSKADFAAAVALKAMSEKGKFTDYTNNNENDDIQAVKQAAAEAVNKVLNGINTIIIDILKAEFKKIKKLIKS